MSDLRSIVDEAIVINLRHQPQKFVVTYHRLRRIYNGKIHRLEAVDGAQLSNRQLQQCSNPYYYRNSFSTPYLDKSILGCSLSHQLAWKRCIEKNYKGVLVCEDDIQIPVSCNRLVRSIVNEYHTLQREGYPEVDILYLGCFGLCKRPSDYYWWDSVVSRGLQVRNGTVKPVTLSPHLFVPEAPGGAHCYIITPRGCQKLLTQFHRDKIITHLDLQINFYRNSLLLLATHPKIALQDFCHSDISVASPRLLNTIFHTQQVAGEHKMPVSWLWSQKVFGLTGWVKLFILLVLLFGWPVYCLVLIIYLYDLWSGDRLEYLHLSVTLTVVLVLRETLRRLLNL